MSPRTVLVVAGIAFVLALGSSPVVRAIARWCGVLARPRPDRWHRAPTPLLGGVAVLAAAGASLAWAPSLPTPYGWLVVGAVAAFLIGLVDDVWRLRPGAKLALEVGLGLFALTVGITLDWTGWPLVDAMLTLVWVTGLTNAFNLVDNMDGACAGVGAIGAASVAAIALAGSDAGHTGAVLVATAFGGALVGFLVHNHPPATVFLGDSGSLAIGFVMAGLTTASRPTSPSDRAVVVLVPLLVVLVPVLDTLLVASSRALAGTSVLRGGTDHTAHRLVTAGLSEAGAVWVLYGVASVAGLTAIATVRFDAGALPGLGVLLLALSALGVLARVSRRAPGVGQAARLARPAPAAAEAPSPTAATPLVSAVVPAANAERWIGRALASVLAQEYPNLEIVVVDDGSTDRTREVVEAFGSAVTLVTGPHRGAAAARNHAIRKSRGEFVAFLDADDEWLPGRVASGIAPMLADPGVGATFCRSTRVRLDGRREIYGEAYERCRAFPPTLWPSALVQTSGATCRRSALDRTGLFDESLCCHDDLDLWIRLAEVSRTVVIPEVLAIYHETPGSLSQRWDLTRSEAEHYGIIARALGRCPERYRGHRRALMAEAHLHWGILYLTRGDHRRARPYLVRSLAVRPTATAWLVLAATCFPRRLVKAVLSEVTRAINRGAARRRPRHSRSPLV